MGKRLVSGIREWEQATQTCVKEACRNRVLHNVAIQTYTFRNERSDELGGMAVNILIFNTKERIQVSMT